MKPQAVSLSLTLGSVDHLTTDAVVAKVAALLQDIAERLSVRKAVPGHIKALLEERGRWAAFNCTRPEDVRITYSRDWKKASLRRPMLRLSAILVGLSESQVNDAVREALESAGMRSEIWECPGPHDANAS
ncbi:MAG: hypothetical protein HPY75_00575 [Actinobacteria bacterium]|nr:hypothetical protein [Actinomycetota bacterium]